MPLFRRRQRADVSSDGAPAFGPAALRRLGLREATFRATDAVGDRTEAWAVEVPGDRAIALWSDLASTHDTGWWPVVLGGQEDESQLAEAVRYCQTSPDAIVEAARQIDTDELLARWKADNESLEDEEWDVVGEWPDMALPSTTFALPYDISTKKPRTTVVALVAVADHTHIPAALGWGSWNACPAPEEHVAMMKRWSERYGAQLVGVSGDVVEMRVASPPTTQEAAIALANEEFLYCEDIVTQGTESISALGATLLNGSAWYFWWD